MVRQVAIFLCIAFTSAALILFLLRPEEVRDAAAERETRAAPDAAAAGAEVARPGVAAATASNARPEAPAASSLPPPAPVNAPVLPPEVGAPAEPLVDLDPVEARYLQRYGGHSHTELVAAAEALAREVGLERDRLLRRRMADGNFVVVRMGESAPALPLGPDGSAPEQTSTTLTDAAGNTEVHVAWLPHAEYPEFYETLAELLWLQAQLRHDDE